MASLFTKIIRGEIPCERIGENDDFFAFLDINPIYQGHTLVVPKKEEDVFFDLDNRLLSQIMVFSKYISRAIERVVPCKRIGVMVAGLEVPHAHVHLVPITKTSQLSFSYATPANPEELKVLGEKIREQLEFLKKEV